MTQKKHEELVKIEKETPAILEYAEAATIKTIGDIAPITDVIVNIRKRIDQVNNHPEFGLEKPKKAAHETWKWFCNVQNLLNDPLKKAEKILTGKIGQFHADQEKLRQIEQFKINEEIRLKEQKERERLEKLAEKQIDRGDETRAEMTIQKAEELNFIAPVIPETQKSVSTDAGKLNVRKDITVEVVNIMELLKAVINKDIAPIFIDINETKLKRLCKDYGIKSGQFGLKITDVYESRITVKK